MAELRLSVNMAMTLDGRVALPDGRWHGLTSQHDRALMDAYRILADALIVGRNSIENDDPLLTVDYDRAERVWKTLGYPNPERFQSLRDAGHSGPLPVMICRSILPSADRKVFRMHRRPLLFITESLANALPSIFQDRAEVCALQGTLEPRRILTLLAKRGLTTVLLEGGPGLNHAFFQDDLVDELNLTVVPFLLGQSSLPSIVDGGQAFPFYAEKRWSLKRSAVLGDEVFLTYARHAKAPSATG